MSVLGLARDQLRFRGLVTAACSHSAPLIHSGSITPCAQHQRLPASAGWVSPFSTASKNSTESANSACTKNVIVTGAAGNLGHKVASHLLAKGGVQRYHLILMDSAPCPPDLVDPKNNPRNHDVEYIQCDFSKYDPSWVRKFVGCDAAMLFAAKHPMPDATSLDSYISMMINSHTLEACAQGKTKRVIFASSNHVVGGMLHENGKISPRATPKFGTKYKLGDFIMDSTLYATAKVAGEAEIQSMVASGRLNQAIILRIGFCQPGENEKKTLSVTGIPNKTVQDKSWKQPSKTIPEVNEKLVEQWWKGMYLKNSDLEALLDHCLEVPLESRKVTYVNGVSQNAESRWEVDDNEIGYSPSPA